QLVAAFNDAPVRGAIGDDADFRVRTFHNLGPRHEGPRGFELAVETLHVVFVIVGALAVVGFIVVPAAAGEIGGGGVVCSRQRSIAYAVAIQIFVAGEAAEFFQI